MAKQLNHSADPTPEVLENGEKVKTVNISVSEYTDTYDDNGNFVQGASEYHSKSETTVEQTEDNTSTPENVVNADTSENTSTEVDNESDLNDETELDNAQETTEEKCSALELKCSTLETELLNLNKQYSALELKCSSLEAYKENKENTEKKIAIECALNEVIDILPADEISEWRKKSLDCSSVDAFKNELKAFAFDLQKGDKPLETLRNSIPKDVVDESTSVWDRLAKLI